MHVVLDVDEHGRLVEVGARARGPPAASDDLGPGGNGGGDQAVHLVDGRDVDQRTLCRAVDCAVPHHELLHRCGEPRDEFVI